MAQKINPKDALKRAASIINLNPIYGRKKPAVVDALTQRSVYVDHEIGRGTSVSIKVFAGMNVDGLQALIQHSMTERTVSEALAFITLYEQVTRLGAMIESAFVGWVIDAKEPESWQKALTGHETDEEYEAAARAAGAIDGKW